MACLINLLNNGVDGVDGFDGVNGVFDNLPFNTAPPHVQKQHFLKGLTKRKENWFFAAAILHILLLLHFQFTLPFGGKNTTLVLLAERPFKKQRPQ